jgi:hypothetical protein
MVRHPHFTQPVFVRFPRPAVMSGRDGADRYPQAEEGTVEVAVTRALRNLDGSVTLAWVQDACALAVGDEAMILRARDATLRTRPDDVRAFFRGQFRAVVAPRTPVLRAAAPPVRAAPDDDPYGF